MGNRLSKIYNRTGDRGETGLAGGRRVPKSHPRIEAIGAVDELNSQLGLLLAELLEARGAHPDLEEIVQVLAPVQHRLFDLGGELAMPEYRALDETEVARLESCIDRWNDELGPLKNFILPGGTRLVAQAHVCRSLARSAERRCQALDQEETLEGIGLRYLNRLSDLLFVAARAIARRQGVAEILWGGGKTGLTASEGSASRRKKEAEASFFLHSTVKGRPARTHGYPPRPGLHAPKPARLAADRRHPARRPAG